MHIFAPSIINNIANYIFTCRWRDWKLIYGQRASIVVIRGNDTGLWVKPIESANLPDITGDSCTKIDDNGQPFFGCLFNLKGNIES